MMRTLARLLTCLVTLVVLMAGPALPPASAAPADFISTTTLLRWIAHFDADRDARELPAAARAMSQFGVFHNPDSAGVYVGFLAGAFALPGSHREALVAAFATLPEEDQWVIVRAIAWSGAPDWKDELRHAAPRFPTRRVMADKYLAGALPTLNDLTIARADPNFWQKFRATLHLAPKTDIAAQLTLPPTPDLVDTLWGYYFANRRYQPVSRLVAMLPWAKDRDHADRLMLGAMAKLTLATNAARDPALNALLKRARSHQPKPVRAQLDEVIEAADTVTVGTIRNEALAAMDELKRKGPASDREIAWWSRMGESAIALGCIGAAAAGQVQLGLPCVVGGAVSSAVVRNLGSGG